MSTESELLRVPLLDPHALSEAQRNLYSRLTDLVDQGYSNAFTTKDANKRFVGPFGIVMHTPLVGEAFYDTASEIGKINGLSARAREVAILVVGAKYGANYQLYAHTALGLRADLSAAQIQSIVDGSVPEGLEEEGILVFEVASALARGAGPLRADLWQRAVEVLSVEGALALTHHVGFYAYLCILLNAFDAKVPE